MQGKYYHLEYMVDCQCLPKEVQDVIPNRIWNVKRYVYVDATAYQTFSLFKAMAYDYGM